MQEVLSNLAHAGGREEFVRSATEPRRAALLFEFAIVGFAILALVVAELMLSSAIHGTNFAGGDGKFAQATIPKRSHSLHLDGAGSQAGCSHSAPIRLPLAMRLAITKWSISGSEK